MAGAVLLFEAVSVEYLTLPLNSVVLLLQVWILILVTLAIIPIVMAALMKYQPDQENNNSWQSILSKNYLYALNILVGQGNGFG